MSDYLSVMRSAINDAAESARTADNREGPAREMWLATQTKHEREAQVLALASIAESLASIEEHLSAVAFWVNNTGPGASPAQGG